MTVSRPTSAIQWAPRLARIRVEITKQALVRRQPQAHFSTRSKDRRCNEERAVRLRIHLSVEKVCGQTSLVVVSMQRVETKETAVTR